MPARPSSQGIWHIKQEGTLGVLLQGKHSLAGLDPRLAPSHEGGSSEGTGSSVGSPGCWVHLWLLFGLKPHNSLKWNPPLGIRGL